MKKKLALIIAALSAGVLIAFAFVWAWFLWILGMMWLIDNVIERLP